MLDQIAPVLKMLEVGIEQQLTPSLEGEMPPYQVKDAQQWLAVLKKDDTAWTRVMKGETTISEAKLDVDTSKSNIISAKTSSQTFSRSMALATAALAKADKKAAETDATEKKKGKKDKKDKKHRQ